MPSKETDELERSYKVRGNLIASVVVIAAVLVIALAFVLFINLSNARTAEQNAQYLQGSAQQSARRIDEWMNDSQTEIKLLASMYTNTLESADQLGTEGIRELAVYTKFDYTTLSLADGTTFDDRGQKVDASQREYYLRGMEGESGVCATEESLFYGDMSIIFYTPLKINGTIVGVITGAYRENSMEEFLSTYFFGEQTDTYLCTSDATVVAHSSDTFSNEVVNVIELYFDGDISTNISKADLESSFRNSSECTFAYEDAEGGGIAYVMSIPSYDWMLVRTFPSTITDKMSSQANRAGILFVGMVALALVAIAAFFLIRAMRERRKLLSESKQASSIVKSSLGLFERFAVVDFEKDTYEYLKYNGIGDGLPRYGQYPMFRYYWQTRFYDAVEAARMKEAFMPDNIRAALKPDVPNLHYEYRVQDLETGEVLWYQLSMLPLQRNSKGVVNSVLMTIQDVSDAKEREIEARHALEDAFREAERASRAKTDFLSSMSHDIRTPMNSIMGLTAIASMHLDDKERVKDCLAKITTSSRHLLGLINEVLDMVKIESGNLGLTEEDFDLPETIESLLAIMMPQIQDKKLSLKVETSDIQHEHVMGDPMRLQQVFVNIMGNSVKFTEPGGEISLRIRELPSRIKGSGCYEFTFSDTGCGMSDDFVKKVYEPFARANDSRVTEVEGTGLGLAIVRSVVNLMNGTIDVKSKLNEGTTFTVTVYLRLREGEEQGYEEFEGLRALIADDELTACESACEVLTSIGMQPEYVLSGDDAIAAVRRASDEARDFVVVILDWKMPGKSGIETAAEIRSILPDDVPILILSAYDWSAIEQEARSVGVDGFISKPMFRSRFVHVMRELLDKDEEAGAGEGAGAGVDANGLGEGSGAAGSTREDGRPAGEAAAKDNFAALKGCDFTGRRVLLAEDNSIAVSIAEEIMGMTGLEVDAAENGRVAVDMLLDRQPGYYDLVFMDIHMPEMNGYDAAQAIRKAAEGVGPDGRAIDARPDLAQIPVVALTADAFTDDVAKARAAGMNAHMAKPMEIDTLIKTLKEWL